MRFKPVAFTIIIIIHVLIYIHARYVNENIFARETDLTSCLVGSDLLGVVFLSSLNELNVALGGAHVLNANVDSLGEDAVLHLLVNLNTNGARSHVPNATSTTVVVLVGHTLVNGTVALDVDLLTGLVDVQVSLTLQRSVSTEISSEQISGVSSVTKGVRHLEIKYN